MVSVSFSSRRGVLQMKLLAIQTSEKEDFVTHIYSFSWPIFF